MYFAKNARISTTTKELKYQMIKKQVNGFCAKMYTQNATRRHVHGHAVGVESRYLTDSQAAGFVTLQSKFPEPSAKEDQNYA